MTQDKGVQQADGLSQAEPTVSALRASIPDACKTYRGWLIYYDPPPIPIRSFDWWATHPDYDASYEGEEDGWVDNGLKCAAATLDDLYEEIDLMQDEWNEANSQFGVGS